jgi:hypothetical protein
MLDEIRKDLPKGKILTTEENIECFIDLFDALLLVRDIYLDTIPHRFF